MTQFMLQVSIITPAKKVLEAEAESVTLPSVDGEITILPHHDKLLTMLEEGIITIRKAKGDEDTLAIGGGYAQTNGSEISILVSRAYGQDEIDEKLTQEALQKAQKIMSESADEKERVDAASIMRRSLVDIKLLEKIRKHRK